MLKAYVHTLGPSKKHAGFQNVDVQRLHTMYEFVRQTFKYAECKEERGRTKCTDFGWMMKWMIFWRAWRKSPMSIVQIYSKLIKTSAKPMVWFTLIIFLSKTHSLISATKPRQAKHPAISIWSCGCETIYQCCVVQLAQEINKYCFIVTIINIFILPIDQSICHMAASV